MLGLWPDGICPAVCVCACVASFFELQRHDGMARRGSCKDSFVVSGGHRFSSIIYFCNSLP